MNIMTSEIHKTAKNTFGKQVFLVVPHVSIVANKLLVRRITGCINICYRNEMWSSLRYQQIPHVIDTIIIRIVRGFLCQLRGPFEKFVDWRQCAAVMLPSAQQRHQSANFSNGPRSCSILERDLLKRP
jgi:hypothetical protein